MASVIDKAVSWALSVANDDTHSYSQSVRWGPHYDCSSFVISAYEQAGVPVKSDGATYTGDMKAVFLRNGFEDVTSKINLSSGAEIKKGDVLLNIAHHAAMASEDGGNIVNASNPTNGILTRGWYNYPWDCILRYTRDSNSSASYTDFPRYELSESAIKDIATCITGETGGEDILACRQEASQIANLNEVTRGRPNTESSVIKTIHDGWYSSNSWTRGCTQTAIDAVTHVLVKGKRVLPRYVTEHDTFPLDIKNAKDKSSYSKGDSVNNVYGSNYQFYCFFGENGNGDISGYFQKDYEKYKSDVVWTDGADSSSKTDEKEYHFIDTNEKVPLHPFLFDLRPIEAEDGMNIFVYSGANRVTHNVTPYIGSVEWHNSETELATSMSFQLAKPQQKWQGYYTPEVGDVVRLHTNAEVFRGIIVDVDYGDPTNNKYTCYDAGWYLNKTKDTYQFNNISIRECLNKILGDLSIPIDSISGITSAGEELDNTTVTDIYIDKAISDIIKDFIDNKLKGRYNFDFTPRGFRLYTMGTEVAYPQFRLSSNTQLLNSIEHRGSESHTGSLENCKTSIKVISDTDVLATARHDYIYKRYGLIQETVKVNPTELEVSPQQYASDKLSESFTAEENYSFEIVEALNSYTRAGQGLYIDESLFVITNTDHSITQGVHKTKLVIERVKAIESSGTNSGE